MNEMPILLKNAKVFDGIREECPEGMNIVVENCLIREISDVSIKAPEGAKVIDVAGRFVMPGLIDAHVHAYFSDVSYQKTDSAGEAYRAAHAVRMLGHALDSGFTTVRDIGGGDYGLWLAIENRLIRAPRFFYAGKMLSMTGGHGDSRLSTESQHNQGYCTCGAANSLSHVVDGVDACIKAAREELRRGAHCIKIMGSGGVASPTDPIWLNQFREDEIRAVVEETAQRRTYTSAHCHPISAIRRCIECGVRVIEHGTLIDGETARFVADRGAYIIPTMTIIRVLAERGPQLGLSAESQEKVESISQQAVEGLDEMRKANVKVGFGTDLLGDTYVERGREFSLRSEVYSPFEILRQATSINAEILQQEDLLGCVKAGAQADLLVLDQNPLEDIGVLAAGGRNIRLIMKGGEIVKNDLG
jgi:imidazolonepropionase-like amidohydrolase